MRIFALFVAVPCLIVAFSLICVSAACEFVSDKFLEIGGWTLSVTETDHA